MYCKIKKASTFLGYQSTSTLYRLINEGLLNDYVDKIEGVPHLYMKSRGKHPRIAKYLMSILAWHADFQINDFDPDRWLRDHPTKS